MKKHWTLAEETDEILLHIAYVYQNMGDYENIHHLPEALPKAKHGEPGRFI